MQRSAFPLVSVIIVASLLFAAPADAKYLGGGPCHQCALAVAKRHAGQGGEVNTATAEFTQTESITKVGSTLIFELYFNSRFAATEGERIDTILGYGWSHSYNIYLFQQAGQMFRVDAQGNITRFGFSGRNKWTSSVGWFETMALTGQTYTITQQDGTRYQFAYVPNSPFAVQSANYRLTAIIDRNGNTTTLTYSGGQLTDIQDTDGNHLTLAYNAGNHLASVADPLGRTTRFTYDSTGRRLAAIEDAAGHFRRYSYDVYNNLTQRQDQDGRTTLFTWQGNGKLAGATDGSGNRLLSLTNGTGWATDPQALVTSQMRVYIPGTTVVTDGAGRQWRYDYDANGYVTRMVAPDGAQTLYGFDPATLRPNSQTDANGHTTSSVYDNQGRLTNETDALGHQTLHQYANTACIDKVTRTTYPNASITDYTYDGACNRISETRDVGGLALVRSWTYDAKGRVLTETDPNSHITTRVYDAAGNLVKATDPEGNNTRYGYDLVANRTCAIDGNGHVSVSEYDQLNRLIRETAKIGTTVAPLDPIAPACVPADADDIIAAEYSYDGAGHKTLVRQQSNTGSPRAWHVTKYAYDNRARLVGETKDPAGEPLNPNPSPLNLVTAYTYDGNDNRIQVTDPRGNHTNYAYDSQNRLTLVTDALGNQTETRYDPVGNRTCAIDGNYHYTFYQYDALNRLTSQARKIGTQECTAGDSDDLITRNYYDSGTTVSCFTDPGSPNCAGPMPGGSNIAYSVDPEQRYTHFKYDKLDRRWVMIRKVGPFVDTSGVCDANDWCQYTKYDPAGNVTARIDANGNRADAAYYANNWLHTETVDPGGLNLITTTTYDGAGNARTVTNPRGNVISNTYDDRNRVVTVVDSIGKVAAYTYDGIGNRTRECDGNDHCTGHGYDAVNRLVESTDPMNNATSNAYDADGNLVEVTDREGHATCHYYDGINRRTRTAQLMGGTDCASLSASDPWTDTGYDAVGKVARLSTARHSTPGDCAAASPPADCETTNYQYDPADRLVLETYADQTTRQFAYDKAGNLAQRTDQLGQVTQYLYNDLYYLTLRDYQDPAEPDDSFAYDIGGRMTRAERDGWVVTYDGYDPVNRVLQTTQDATGIPMTVQYAYDTAAGTRDLTYPGGRTCHEQKDRRERLADNTCDSFDATYAYDLGNRVMTRTYNNGVAANYGYDANNRITSLTHANGGTVADFGYAYDKEGNKQYEDKAHDPAKSEAYAYDALYRLIDYKVGTLIGSTVPLPTTQTQYNLDKVGNWDQFTKDSDGAGPGVPIVYQNTPNQMNEYDDPSTNGPGEIPDDLGIPYNFKDLAGTPAPDGENWAHDKNGNRREDGHRVYAYDDENRLVRVTRKSDNLVSEYRYDALSRRVAKTVGIGMTPVTTRYAYDDARIVEEQDGAAAALATYVYGNYIDEVLNMQRGGADYYYHQNALWSVVAVTDASAVVLERYNYMDYGCPSVTISAIGNPWMFTGRQWDRESGLYFYRARHYDCEVGRFLQRDPVSRLDTGNAYFYVSDNPNNHLDAFGYVNYAPGGVRRFDYCSWEQSGNVVVEDGPPREVFWLVVDPKPSLNCCFDCEYTAQKVHCRSKLKCVIFPSGRGLWLPYWFTIVSMSQLDLHGCMRPLGKDTCDTLRKGKLRKAEMQCKGLSND